jgi:hypothetical protein
MTFSISNPGTPAPTQAPAQSAEITAPSAARDGITRRETVPASQESVAERRPPAPPAPPAGSQRGQTVDISV